MTWADTLDTGDISGANFRLVVEGWPESWVTDAAITGGTTGGNVGRVNRPGLEFTGLKISESAVLRDAWVTAKGITFTINPTGAGSGGGQDEETVASFTRTPTPVGYLKSELTLGSKVYLSNGKTFPAGTMLHLATEAVRVTSSASDSGGAYMNVTRQYWQTQSQFHKLTYGPAQSVFVPVYLHPPTMEGRRCFLIVYGTGDDVTGGGTVIWKGIVSRPPKMNSDGISWTIQTDNVIKSLEQRVAASSGTEYKIRGIYHPGSAPLNVEAHALYDGASTSSSFLGPLISVYGFWETQQNFIDAVNAAMASAVASGPYSTVIQSLQYDERSASPTIQMVVETVTDLKNVSLVAASVLEGDLQSLESIVSERFSGESHHISDNFRTEPGVGWDHYFGNSSQEFMAYGWREGDPKSPASVFSYPLSPTRAVAGYPDRNIKGFNFWQNVYTGGPVSSGNPARRIYLNTVEGLEVGDTLAIIREDSAVQIKINYIQPADAARFIEFDFVGADYVVYMDQATRIVPLRVFAQDGNLDDFCLGLTTAVIDANDGDTPYIPSTDLDHSALTLAFGGYANIDDYWRHRNYVYLKPVSVKTILSEELKAIGWMMRLDYLGSASFCPLPLVSATTDAVAQITDADILTPAGKTGGMWPLWEAQTDGIVNTVNARFGYKPFDDDFDPVKDYTIREVNSIAEHKSNGKGAAEIAPRSVPSRVPQIAIRVNGWYHTKGGGERAAATPAQISAWVSNYMRVLAMDYAQVTIAVPFKFFNLMIGDIVEVTSVYIPNGIGGRGVTAAKAAVIAREWNLDPRVSDMGKLTLYFPRQISGGYTPSGRIVSKLNLSGNSWQVTVPRDDAANVRWSTDGSGVVARQFAIGDAVRIVQTNSASPTTVQATITNINTGSDAITFTTASTWTPGSTVWNIIFDNDSAVNDRQHQFVYVADNTQTLFSGEFARQLL